MARFSGVAVGALVMAASLGTGLAQAQESNASDTKGVEEVVVTAQKSGVQSIQTAPLAIQAFSGAQLKERNIGSIGDLGVRLRVTSP